MQAYFNAINKLWFDVERRYKTIISHSNMHLFLLWFDVERRYKTIEDACAKYSEQLWFDVERRYKTITQRRVSTPCMEFTNIPLPPTRRRCVEGEEERAYLIGLTLYAMICRKELRYAFAVGRGRDSYAPSGIRFNPASKDTPANPSLFINGP